MRTLSSTSAANKQLGARKVSFDHLVMFIGILVLTPGCGVRCGLRPESGTDCHRWQECHRYHHCTACSPGEPVLQWTLFDETDDRNGSEADIAHRIFCLWCMRCMCAVLCCSSAVQRCECRSRVSVVRVVPKAKNAIIRIDLFRYTALTSLSVFSCLYVWVENSRVVLLFSMSLCVLFQCPTLCSVSVFVFTTSALLWEPVGVGGDRLPHDYCLAQHWPTLTQSRLKYMSNNNNTNVY